VRRIHMELVLHKKVQVLRKQARIRMVQVRHRLELLHMSRSPNHNNYCYYNRWHRACGRAAHRQSLECKRSRQERGIRRVHSISSTDVSLRMGTAD
jgi:hypothetical protein